MTFESNSQLKHISFRAFEDCSVRVLIPSSILFIAWNVHPYLDNLTLSDGDVAVEVDSNSLFDRWRWLRKSGLTIDFQRSQGSDLRFRSFEDSVIELSGFEEGSILGQSDRIVTQVHRRRSDGILTVVKTISFPIHIESFQIETSIANLMNLHHPMITPLIGCSIQVESMGVIELKTVRSYSTDITLADVLVHRPVWWTPTTKAKTVVGIALGLRFAHWHGMLHGSVKASNILFDTNRNYRIQITDFKPIGLENGSVQSISHVAGVELNLTVDISGFASLLSEIVVDRTAHSDANSAIGSMIDPYHGATVPEFVLGIIEAGQSPESHDQFSFIKIIDHLKANDFQILSGVDREEVSEFVTWVELSEQTGEWE
jgi:hypothetical protein